MQSKTTCLDRDCLVLKWKHRSVDVAGLPGCRAAFSLNLHSFTQECKSDKLDCADSPSVSAPSWNSLLQLWPVFVMCSPRVADAAPPVIRLLSDTSHPYLWQLLFSCTSSSSLLTRVLCVASASTARHTHWPNRSVECSRAGTASRSKPPPSSSSRPSPTISCRPPAPPWKTFTLFCSTVRASEYTFRKWPSWTPSEDPCFRHLFF